MLCETPDGFFFKFTHIPRTSGRFIIQNLLRNGIKFHNYIDGYAKLFFDGRRLCHLPYLDYKQYLETIHFSLPVKYEDLPNFTVVRDPVQKFISASQHFFFILDYNNDRIDRNKLEDFSYFKYIMEEQTLLVPQNTNLDSVFKGVVRDPDGFYTHQIDYAGFDNVEWINYEEGPEKIIQWLSEKISFEMTIKIEGRLIDSSSPIDTSKQEISEEILKNVGEYYYNDAVKFGYVR